MNNQTMIQTTLPIIDFWRDINEGRIRNPKCRLAGWTNVRGTDIATIEVDGVEKRIPVSMTDADGVNILSDQVRAIYQENNPVFLHFFFQRPKVIVFTIQPPESSEGGSCRKKNRVYSRCL